MSGAICILLLIASVALANGVYIPDRAIEKLPSIPVQRALITHREGIETLMVESAVQAESANVGWILPLPQAPTTVAKGEPGTLVSLSMALRPEIVHDLHRPWMIPLGVLALFTPPLLALVLTRNRSARAGNVVAYVLVSALLLFLWSALLPSLSREAGASAAGVEILASQRVGNYSVDVLSAAAVADLQRWLDDNGLQKLSAQAHSVISDYIARGWCFAVARLEVTPDTVAAPHPLAFTFPSAAPVFPMKLTALAGSKTHVELIVAADQSAEAAGFHPVCSSRFRLPSGKGDLVSDLRLLIANPDARRHLWDGCIVTRLQADLEPSAMAQDVAIALRPYTPHRDRFHTPRARAELMAAIVGWSLVPAAITMAIACRGMRPPRRAGLVATALILGTGLVAAVGYARSLNVRSDIEVTKGGRYADFHNAFSVREALAQYTQTWHANDPELGKKVLGVLHESAETRHNPLQGGDRRWERSPGNVYLTEEDSIAVHDLDTRPGYPSAPLPRNTHPTTAPHP